jgi:hypothetical protein
MPPAPDDVPAFGAEGAPDPDLAGALGDAGEHDVHDPDAADQERDGGDRTQDDVEDLLGALGLAEHLERHDHLVVLFLVVVLHELLDRVGHGEHLLAAGHLDGDLMELDALGLEAARALLHQDFAVAGLGGLERDEHPVRRRIIVGIGGFGAASERFHDADDPVVITTNAHVATERGVQRKEQGDHFSAEDANVGAGGHLLVVEEAALEDALVAHGGEPRDRGQHIAVHAPADVPRVLAHDALGHEDGDARDGELDAANVGVGEAVFEDITLAALVGDLLFLRGFDALEDDVLAAEVLDLFLSLVAGAFADGEHGDDGADAEDNAQNREERAQPVQPEASHAEAHGPAQAREREPGRPADGLEASRRHRFRSGRRAGGGCAGRGWRRWCRE